MKLPRYPLYVPSRGRYDPCITAEFLVADQVPFRIVVEHEEVDLYAARYGEDRLLVLDQSNQGLIYARNWIWAHAASEGHARFWMLDDNISYIMRRYRARRLRCNAGPALAVAEDLTDRYTNVAISGLNYAMFIPDGRFNHPPFRLNIRVYSASLVRTDLPFRYRSALNDDTDICLTALSRGYCTILLNVFLIQKRRTMTVRGGNTGIYRDADGRLKMAKALERLWPYVVETDRRYGRPQHVVRDQWKKFDTPLIPRDDLDRDVLPDTDEYGLELRQVADEVRSPLLRRMLEENLKP